LFNQTPTRTTPDLEQLVVDTARTAENDPRLFIMAATWLSQYGYFVAKHRLSRMVAKDLNPREQATVGLLIDFARQFGKRALSFLPGVVRDCRPVVPPQPLFAVDRSNTGFAKLVAAHACEASKRWGLLTDELEPAFDALRPVEWILDHNPIFRIRARFRNDLRLSILMCLEYEDPSGASEAELMRHCGVTRRAMHNALDTLWQAGDVHRRPVKRGYSFTPAA
jgi:hypothetical protein